MIQKGDVVRVVSSRVWSEIHGKLGLVMWDTDEKRSGMVRFFDGSDNGSGEGWYLDLSDLEKVDDTDV